MFNYTFIILSKPWIFVKNDWFLFDLKDNLLASIVGAIANKLLSEEVKIRKTALFESTGEFAIFR